MQIGIPQERRSGEARVVATPETVKKHVTQGQQVVVQAGAGMRTSQANSAYEAVGATIGTAAQAPGAQLVLKVPAPTPAELAGMNEDSVLVGMQTILLCSLTRSNGAAHAKIRQVW